MKSFLPVKDLNDSALFFLKNKRRNYNLLFFIITGIVIATLISLPYIKMDITVRSAGLVRPQSERTDVRPIITGIIDTIFYKEGDIVEKGNPILLLRNNNSLSKKILNDYELTQRRQYIHDLRLLTEMGFITSGTINNLNSPVYKQQISKFIYQQIQHTSQIKKAEKELEMDIYLASEKVIASKELFDKEIESEKLQGAYSSFKQEQKSVWQQDLARYQLELQQLESQQQQLNEEQKYYTVKAPVTGSITGINNKYAGAVIQMGETICTISPETDLIAECNVETKDVGLLQNGKDVKFKIDAFDYNYFGILTGKIISISDDYTLVDNRPVFKVKCSFDSTQLQLKNGFKGQLKKGLTFQASFLVTRRTLSQLLFDKVNDWLNPVAPTK